MKNKKQWTFVDFWWFWQKKLIMGKKLGFMRKKLVTSQLQNALKTVRFFIFQKNNFLRSSFRLKKRPLKGFCEKTKRTVFLTIFVNLQKRLETAVLEGHCKFSMKSIICYISIRIGIRSNKTYCFWFRFWLR